MAARRNNKVTAEQWERVKELFEAALDCAPQDRTAFLSRLGQDDPALAEQVSGLIASHEEAGDFLQQPLIFAASFLDDLEEPQRFSPDEVLCNRFKIIRLIGKGGMGEVYEAFDQELEERVALKTLRFEVSSNEIFTARFRREIQLARKVTHPNVCRIFESLRHQSGNESISVLSMELLQGQTLSEYLKIKGRLIADEALPLARQIIDGLNAVHAAGIIHRDLKPSNLILVPEGDTFQVKITDFGIAGRLPENPSQPALTQASKMLGTPDYMAPEQLEQGRATIQSDIYSLGLVLYEMVTGAKPFAEAGAWKRLYEDPCPPKKLAPDLPDQWNKTIVCCLERDPQYRFSSANALAENLSDALLASIPTKPLILRLKAAARKGAWLIFAFFVVSAALSIPVMRYFRQSAEIPPGTTVLVTDISTTDPVFSGVTVALKSQLAQSAHFEVEEDRKIVDIVKQMNPESSNKQESWQPGDPMDASTARQVAWRSGAPLVISGSLAEKDHGYVLSMTLERVKYNPIFPTFSRKQDFPASSQSDLLNAIRNASTWVRGVAGEPEADLSRQDRPVEDTTTSSWQALQSYSDAEKKYSAGDEDGTFVLLNAAINADPGFAKAHMRMADILISKNNYADGYSEWQKAIDLNRKHQLTNRESLRIEGQFFEDAGDFIHAAQKFQEYAVRYPHDYLAWFYWGSVLDSMDRKEDALAKFSQALACNPRSSTVRAHMAMVELVMGDFETAHTLIEEINAAGDHDLALGLFANSSFLQGRFNNALAYVERLGSSQSKLSYSRAFLLKAQFLAEMGKFTSANAALHEGIGFDHNRRLNSEEADKHLSLALIAWRNNDVTAARTEALEALHVDYNPRLFAQVGALLGRAGDVAKLRSMLQDLTLYDSTLPLIGFTRACLEAEIALAAGDRRLASNKIHIASSIVDKGEALNLANLSLMLSVTDSEDRQVRERIVKNPARLFLYRSIPWPGLWAESLYKLIVSRHLSQPSDCKLIDQYLHLREAADPNVQPELRNVHARAPQCTYPN